MSKKISKREEELFFGKSPEPAFDGGENTAQDFSETEYYKNAARAFLGTEEAGLEEVQELDDLGFFEILHDFFE